MNIIIEIPVECMYSTVLEYDVVRLSSFTVNRAGRTSSENGNSTVISHVPLRLWHDAYRKTKL